MRTEDRSGLIVDRRITVDETDIVMFLKQRRVIPDGFELHSIELYDDGCHGGPLPKPFVLHVTVRLIEFVDRNSNPDNG